MEYGLIGEKLSHSFSKIIHKELFDYSYILKEISPDNLNSFLLKKDFKAINVTIPYKQKVIPYLDFISDKAKKIGAVNTVVNNNGKLYGYNTDYYGMVYLLNKINIQIRGKNVFILGSGGTSKTALEVVKDLGAKSIYIVSREKNEDTITYEEMYQKNKDVEIIINTTPCGMFPNNDGLIVDIDKFPSVSGVVDAIYNPLNSNLIVAAKERGIKAIGGLYMLISQAAISAEYFTDSKIESKKIDEIYKKIHKEKQNIVLIGMPSCGKTTIGNSVAQLLSKTFIDTDLEIEKLEKCKVSQIIQNDGEEEFRKIESLVVENISKMQGLVIATGGGVILNNKNIKCLKQNGIVIFIDRPLDLLLTTPDRPLSSNRDMLTKRFNERYNKYLNSADIVIDAKGDLKENINLVKEAFLNENSCD